MKFITSLFRRQSVVFMLAAGLPLAATASSTGVAGVGNFQKVDEHVYRGAQPTELGFQNLAKLGIQTVVDLQQVGDARSVSEEKWVKAAGMQYVSVPMRGMGTPSDESVAKVLALLENTKTGPVFVHCHRGADRTGGVIACYRVEHDHWENAKALSEARHMGMSWYQIQIQHYVTAFHPKANGSVTTEVAEAESKAPATAVSVAAPMAAAITAVQ